MLSMFFFLALYMQNIRDYTPLQAGIRFLPSTVLVIVMGPLAGRFADRVGPRPLMTLGLLLVSGALFLLSQVTVSSGYGTLLPGFILMGIGIGLTMSPMSTAAMNSVEQTKAGVASGILSQNRMVGGTFGVAVTGALVASLGGSKINQLLPGVPSAARSRLTESLGSGGVLHGVPPKALEATHIAYVYALQSGLRVGAAVALLGSVLAWTLVAPRARAMVPAHGGAAHGGATHGGTPDRLPEAPEPAAEVVHV